MQPAAGTDPQAEPAWRRPAPPEQHWPVAVTIAVAIVLQSVLPNRLVLHPRPLPPIIEGVLLVTLIATNPVRVRRESPAVRGLALAMVVVLIVVNVVSVILLVRSVLRGDKVSAAGLLAGGVAVWITNVIAYAVAYWETDRGGPRSRDEARDLLPDFLFPQMQEPALARPDWRPLFVDYLYVSFTNATAFSPTDTMPMTRGAKASMSIQAGVALITIVLVAARAVNVLS